jgi:hypothetical protein
MKPQLTRKRESRARFHASKWIHRLSLQHH